MQMCEPRISHFKTNQKLRACPFKWFWNGFPGIIGRNIRWVWSTTIIILFEPPMKFVSQTLLVHNFSLKNPFLTKPVPIESPEFWLSIGTGFVKNGSFYEKLWTNKVSKTNFIGGSKRMIIVVTTLNNFQSVGILCPHSNTPYSWISTLPQFNAVFGK